MTKELIVIAVLTVIAAVLWFAVDKRVTLPERPLPSGNPPSTETPPPRTEPVPAPAVPVPPPPTTGNGAAVRPSLPRPESPGKGPPKSSESAPRPPVPGPPTAPTREPERETAVAPSPEPALPPPVRPLAPPEPPRIPDTGPTSPPMPATPVPPPPVAVAPATRGTQVELAAVRQVLALYEQMYDQLDASAAPAIWPQVDSRALARVFARLGRQDLTFDGCVLAVSDATATAECTGWLSYVPRVGPQTPHREHHSWTIELARHVASWQIVKVTGR
jgi:hypothetical protein